MADIIEISELDCIYLSYDEPQAEEFWAKISANIPWAKRVHGVKGSDAAHKAAANASDTDRFILIDGDNLPQWDFFNQQLRLTDTNKDCVFRWRAYNHVNGLCYGNGGLSSWTKEFVLNMQTHEATNGSEETVVEFCFDDRYWAMHDVWSTTYPNGDSFHAWRAGFREGVKLCLDRGRRPEAHEFETATWEGNRHNLAIWCTVGADVEYGDWAILGARQGAVMTMFEDHWDYTAVRDFDRLEELYKHHFPTHVLDPDLSDSYLNTLTKRLGMNIVDLTPEQSAWYKKYNRKYENVDIMLPERDYQRALNEVSKQFWR